MKDVLRDISRCVNGFNFEVIKLTADPTETLFEAVTADRTVIMKGKANTPVQGLNGVFGLSNLNILNGIINLTAMKAETSDIQIINRDGEPEELLFTAPGMRSAYRLMSNTATLKQPTFKVSEFDVIVNPTKGVLGDFKEQSSIFSSVSTKFKPKVKSGNLTFTIGDTAASNHNSEFVFSEVEPNTELKGSFEYPISETLKALSLINYGTCSLCYSSRGAQVINIDTGIITFSFIFPGFS